MSEGKRSGVNCTRLKRASMSEASVLMASVLARPGTPSSRMCPSLKRPVSRESIKWRCPTMLRSMPVVRSVRKPDCASMSALSSRMSIAVAILFLFFLFEQHRFCTACRPAVLAPVFFEVMTLELGKHSGAKLVINPILSNKKVPTSGRC